MILARKKPFDSLRVTGLVFSSHAIVFRFLEIVKKLCVKESKHLNLFSQCFGNFYSSIQIKSSDYWDGVSSKLKYLNVYHYIFNFALFFISLEASHFGSTMLEKKYSNATEIYKFYNFNTLPPNLKVEVRQFLKKMYLKRNIKFRRRERRRQRNYEIYVLVPFIVSGIVWKLGSVDLVSFWFFHFCILCLNETVVTFKGK